MFLGELCCLLAFLVLRAFGFIEKPPSFNIFIFLLPALCDMCGTSLMLIGLLLTYASNFQMLRGSVVLFTGTFSRVFLKRHLNLPNWVGMVLVLLGTGVVGLDALLHPDSSASASDPALGNLIIVLAQIVVAAQMVLEEKFVNAQNVPPLLAVGLEGMFGFLTLSGFCAAAYFIPGVRGLSETPVRLEDLLDALEQLGSGNLLLLLGMVFAILSIAFYNFFGISVTKNLSAAHRMVLDSTRTVIVWLFSLIVHAAAPESGHGQAFSYLQLVGFLILVAGSIVYYEIIPIFPARKATTSSRDDPLLVRTDVGVPMPSESAAHVQESPR
jgi:drug/metabolite transporter (DMT)-like permease